jgi:hypothetical protein
VPVPGPAKTADRVYVGRDYFCYSTSQEIPYDDAAVIAANGEQRSIFVVGTRNGQGDAI